MSKRRRGGSRPAEERQPGTRPSGGGSRRSRRRAAPPSRRPLLPWLVGGGAIVIAMLLGVAYVGGLIPGLDPGGASPTPGSIGSPPVVSPPVSTPLADPPAEPASDGTRATIETELGNIVLELYTDSAPVASENFINLAQAGFYEGVVFHRIVPGFVIQGGDPLGTGGGGPGYTIVDEPVVGEYVRGTVAMARTTAPNSQGSQFFIVLDDSVRQRLPKSGGYVIFGRVLEGMEIVDRIAAGPNSGPPSNQAVEPVAMRRVTIEPPQ